VEVELTVREGERRQDRGRSDVLINLRLRDLHQIDN
jgi:hypothetical protein